MKIAIYLVSALFVAVQAVGSRTNLEETCNPAVPERCPLDDEPENCTTCCCESSDNVEFYDPESPEPECTALPAVYEMTFVFTWSGVCHPDYYFPDESKWSPPTGVSHNTGYRMWDACMDAASPGVGLVSQTGDTSVINQEYAAAMEYILDSTQGELVPQGSGSTSSKLIVDKNHQWVSAISMLVPSPDRLVGVADLRLCDGDGWKERVKVCFELFSTAIATDKVVGEMERNSLQSGNCSFGYVEFNLLRTQEDEPRTDVAEICNPILPGECSSNVDECATCCCDSSDNVEFYDPESPEPECTAPPAVYEMTFVFTWSGVCHPDYYFPNESKWSPPTGVSHNIGYRMWDACMDAASPGVGLVSQTGDTSVINQEYSIAGDKILDMAQGDLVPRGSGTTARNLTVDKDHQWVSAISMLVPSPDRLVGVADLRLCDGDKWRENVKVCFELFSTATATEKVVGEMERNSLQNGNCSFGYVEFKLQEERQEQTEEPTDSSITTGALTAITAALALIAVLFHRV